MIKIAELVEGIGEQLGIEAYVELLIRVCKSFCLVGEKWYFFN